MDLSARGVMGWIRRPKHMRKVLDTTEPVTLQLTPVNDFLIATRVTLFTF